MLASASRRSNILLAKRANRPLRLGAGLKIRPSNGEQDYGRDPPTHPETVFMNKIVLGILLGGVLGIFDGLSALISAPETAPDIVGIVIGSTVKGLIAGAVIGAVSRKVQSLPIGIFVGLLVGLALAYPIALMNAQAGHNYYWQIMLPGGVLGMIVGFATQKYGALPRRAAA